MRPGEPLIPQRNGRSIPVDPIKKWANGLFVLACVCLLFVVMSSPMRAQTTFTTHILCTDGLSGDSISLGIGVNSLATYGIDSTLLGEKEQPPFPPVGVFYAVLVDPRGDRATRQ